VQHTCDIDSSTIAVLLTRPGHLQRSLIRCDRLGANQGDVGTPSRPTIAQLGTHRELERDLKNGQGPARHCRAARPTGARSRLRGRPNHSRQRPIDVSTCTGKPLIGCAHGEAPTIPNQPCSEVAVLRSRRNGCSIRPCSRRSCASSRRNIDQPNSPDSPVTTII